MAMAQPGATSAALRVRLLGKFRLLYGELPATSVSTPRLQTLLAYLILHRHAPQARRHLAFLSWPDSTEAQAHTNLRHLLHELLLFGSTGSPLNLAAAIIGIGGAVILAILVVISGTPNNALSNIATWAAFFAPALIFGSTRSRRCRSTHSSRSSTSMKHLLASLFILTLLLAACGGSPAAPPAAPTATPQPIAVPPAVTTVPTSAPAAATIPAATKAPVATPVPATLAPAATSAPAAAPAPAGNARDAIIATMLAQLKAGPYRTKTTIVSDNGTINLTGEMVPPDKLRTTMQTAGFATETIAIGDKAWVKRDGKWEASPVSGKVTLEAAFPALTAEQLGGTISDATAAGAETVNGEQARVYTYTSTTDLGGSKAISAVKLWVSVKSGLPIKQEIAGEAAGVKSTTVQTIEYDKTITIAPPM